MNNHQRATLRPAFATNNAKFDGQDDYLRITVPVGKSEVFVEGHSPAEWERFKQLPRRPLRASDMASSAEWSDKLHGELSVREDGIVVLPDGSEGGVLCDGGVSWYSGFRPCDPIGHVLDDPVGFVDDGPDWRAVVFGAPREDRYPVRVLREVRGRQYLDLNEYLQIRDALLGLRSEQGGLLRRAWRRLRDLVLR